jgi:hypothetical protein
MSIQSQAIIRGHHSPDTLVSAVRQSTQRTASARATRSPDYWLIETETPHGIETLHAFIGSSAVEDYREVTTEPSILISIQSSPFARAIVRELAAKWGGFYRETEMDQWLEVPERGS